MTKLRLIAVLLCASVPFSAHASASAPSLADSLKAAGRFSTFLSLQEIAGATQGQRGATQGQRTYLVPNDEAFAKLGAGTLQLLRKDPERLDAFFKLHSMPTRLMVADMFYDVQGSKKSFQSSQGHVLGFQCNGHEGMHRPQVMVFDTAIQREIRNSGMTAPSSTQAIKREIRSSGVTASPSTDSILRDIRSSGVQKPSTGNTVQGNLIGTDAAAWNAPSQGRIGSFQDVVVAEGIVHELDGVLLADGITR